MNFKQECSSCVHRLKLQDLIFIKKITSWAFTYNFQSLLFKDKERIPWYWKRSFKITDYFSGVKKVRKIASCLSRQLNFSEEEEFGINLALDEAVTNAWEAQLKIDKNKLDKESKINQRIWGIENKADSQNITVEFTLGFDKLCFIVVDNAGGFSPGAHCSIDILREHGRGCYLMQIYMDKVIWYPSRTGGTKCTLVKNLPDSYFISFLKQPISNGYKV